MVIEIVYLPIEHGNCPSFFVCLPEGTYPKMLQYVSIPRKMMRSQVSRAETQALEIHPASYSQISNDLGKFDHDLTDLPHWKSWLDCGESSQNGRKIQVSEIL